MGEIIWQGSKANWFINISLFLERRLGGQQLIRVIQNELIYFPLITIYTSTSR